MFAKEQAACLAAAQQSIGDGLRGELDRVVHDELPASLQLLAREVDARTGKLPFGVTLACHMV